MRPIRDIVETSVADELELLHIDPVQHQTDAAAEAAALADSVPAAEAHRGHAMPPAEDDTPLVSASSAAAISSAFDALTLSHTLQNSGMIADMAREMLRPMLKAWLDDNLPVMVERLVRVEIERVARGGR